MKRFARSYRSQVGVTRRQRMSCSPAVPILCCRRRFASARPVRQLSLQAGSRPRDCGRVVPGGGSGGQADLAQRPRQRAVAPDLELAGTDVSSERNTIMGFYPTRDGRWSYLHCNFPNHRAAALSVLGVAEDREAVARAVATWNAADLEEAIIAAKGAGGMARTQA